MADKNDTTKDVKTAIIEAAEIVFATYGFYGATTRAIADAAGVTLALIHYHFGSKELLFEKVLLTRAGELTRARLERLRELRARPEPPSLEQVLAALVGPAFHFGKTDLEAARNYGRIANQVAYADDERSRRMMSKMYNDLAADYVDAIERSLPGLGRVNAVIAYTFAIVLSTQTLIRSERIEMLSGEAESETNFDRQYEVTFEILVTGVRGLVASDRPAIPAL